MANFLKFLCLFVVSLSFAPVTESVSCHPAFDDLCECGYVPYGPNKRFTYITNCTNSGFDHTMMLRFLSPLTEVLIFVGNEVRDLPLNIFGQEVIYEKLHTIDFSNNHIQTIKGRTFHNVANVSKLILNDNDLYIVSKDSHPRMFSNFVNLKELSLVNAFTEKVKAGEYLTNLMHIFENSSLNHLKVLNLESNEISDFNQNVFCSLPELEELYLGNNHLQDIPLNFTCLRKLRKLDVVNNLIPHLSDAALENLDQIKNSRRLMINLTYNPFRCDCHMVRTYIWMLASPIHLSDREMFFCVDGLPPVVGKRISAVQLNQLQCLPVLKLYQFHYSASLITLTVGMSFVLAVLIIVIYRNKETVGASWRRVLYPIRSKFHYVSLDRRATMDL